MWPFRPDERPMDVSRQPPMFIIREPSVSVVDEPDVMTVLLGGDIMLVWCRSDPSSSRIS